MFVMLPVVFTALMQQLVLQLCLFIIIPPNCEANDFFHTAGWLRLSHLVKYLVLNLHKPILPGRLNRWLVLWKNQLRFDRDVQKLQLIVPPLFADTHMLLSHLSSNRFIQRCYIFCSWWLHLACVQKTAASVQYWSWSSLALHMKESHKQCQVKTRVYIS